VNLRPARALLLSFLAVILGGCLGNSGSPTAPPTDIHAYPGDAEISVTWYDLPYVTYWLFYAQDPTVTPLDLDNNNNPLLNFGYAVPTVSPMILCNSSAHAIVNQSISANGGFPPYFITINGRTGTAKGGPGSAPVATLPRPAGGGGAPWVAGATIPSAVNGLTYVGVTTCGFSGMPPQGIYFAVGPSGAVYSSNLARTVAGPLTNPGNKPMAWIAGNIPLGFGANLNAVAGHATYVENPTDPGLVVVAVGDGGAIIRTLDGQHWQQANPIPLGDQPQQVNLHDVAFSGTYFIAVGDNGLILTSADALNWTPYAYSEGSNPSHNTLRAVHCAGSTCFAVGDAGTILLSSSGGASWAPIEFGTNNWTMIAYGNNDANSDAVFLAGVYYLANQAINTWVVADAEGNYGFLNSGTGGQFLRGPSIIAPGIVSMDYSTNFVALDSAGNAWISEDGTTGSWASYSSAQVAGTGGSAVAVRSTGDGFVAVGSSGANAASF
jgi:hypothetical protein